MLEPIIQQLYRYASNVVVIGLYTNGKKRQMWLLLDSESAYDCSQLSYLSDLNGPNNAIIIEVTNF